MTTNTKTLIQTILAFAMTNNITAIWRMKITIEMLEAELGRINERGRKDLAVVERYITGRGAKAHEAVAALQRLDPMADQSAPTKGFTRLLRANVLGDKLGSLQKKRQQETEEARRWTALARRVESYTGIHPSKSATIAELREALVELERPSRKVRRAA